MMSLRPLVEGKWLTVWVCYNRRVRRSVDPGDSWTAWYFPRTKTRQNVVGVDFSSNIFGGETHFQVWIIWILILLGWSRGITSPDHTPLPGWTLRISPCFFEPKRLGREESSSPPGLSKLQLLRKRLDDTMRAAEGGVHWLSVMSSPCLVVQYLGIILSQLYRPNRPKSSKYLLRRCFDPLKAFSGGVWGSKHLLTKYLED